jgi:hypothetical protein
MICVSETPVFETLGGCLKTLFTLFRIASQRSPCCGVGRGAIGCPGNRDRAILAPTDLV